jgi:hypothetical protein
MGIDIDAFLEDFDSADDIKKEEKVEVTKEKKIDLTFDKYVNDKFNKLQENVNEEDFKFLVKAYSEIKKFDHNLPTRLLELNKTSSSVLNTLGKKYTVSFLEGIKANKNKHGTFITQNLAKITELISQKQIPKAINLYNQITSSYQLFPKEFIIEKIELGKKLRDIEIKINVEFEVFWAQELKQIRKNLSKEISTLKQNLVPGKIEFIEANLHAINTILDSAPSIFYNELVKERIQVAKIIIMAEEYLKKQYLIEFEEKLHQFQELFEKFHKYQIRKDVNSALTCYDEILYLFEKMPDAFIEKKIEIYDKINKTFESLNNLLLTNSISQFMDTYSSSKVLSQAREYISHAKMNPGFDPSNLISIKYELNKIPDQLTPEKIELENQIIEMLDSKTIHNAKLYLEKSFKEKNLDINKLKQLKDKLSHIPDKNHNDKKIILDKIESIISRVEEIYKKKQEKKIEVRNEEENKTQVEKTKVKTTTPTHSGIKVPKSKSLNHKLEITKNNSLPSFEKTTQNIKMPEQKIGTKIEHKFKEHISPVKPKVLTSKHNVHKKQQEIKKLINVKTLNKNKLNNVNLTMIEEINKNYDLIQTSKDSGEIERLTKKINFYISLLPLTQIQKEHITSELNTR